MKSAPQLAPGLETEPTADNVKEFLWQRLLKLAPDAALTNDWESFFCIYDRILRGMAGKCLFQRDDRDDLVQDVWVQVLVHMPKLVWPAHHGRLRGWLCKLIRNKAINFLRDNARRPDAKADPLMGQDLIDRRSGPDHHLEGLWDHELLDVLLARLQKKPSAVNRRLLAMRFLQDRSIAEVARALNLTERQVTYRQHRMYRKLRVALAWYQGEAFPRAPPDIRSAPRRPI
jgi:RNA polymerase sigma factor (sigma-70 family)